MDEFKRIMLKVSGEALGGKGGVGVDVGVLDRVSREIAGVIGLGKQVGVVMGAGNFFRGVEGIAGGVDRAVADQMGMIATLLNALALKEGLASAGVGAEVLSAIPVGPVTETYSVRRAREVLAEGRLALCAAGTGNPYFTTDTAAVLRALELGCDVLFKASKVDGVYDKDPIRHPDARRFDRITYEEVLERKLGVMDLTAVTLARENGLPMVVFNLGEEGAMLRIARGDLAPGTLIESGRM
jgi:uridylate kinase